MPHQEAAVNRTTTRLKRSLLEPAKLQTLSSAPPRSRLAHYPLEVVALPQATQPAHPFQTRPGFLSMQALLGIYLL